MVSKLSAKIADHLCATAVITEEDKDLYSYGFFVILSRVLFFFIAATFGLILHIAIESIVFFILFCSIRSYAGGVHASSELKCSVYTTSAILLCILGIKLFIQYNLDYILAFILILSLICILAYLFFAGIIYGNTPKEMSFTCNVPSGVCEYEAGDKIELHIKTENVGRPFKAVTFDSLDVYIYQEIDGKRVTPYDVGYRDDLPCEWTEELIKTGYTYETTCTFILLISGYYETMLSLNGLYVSANTLLFNVRIDIRPE